MTLNLFANELDSLKKTVNTLEDKDKAAVFNRIFVISGPYSLQDSSLYFAEQALQFAREYQDTMNIAFAYRNLGFYHNDVGNYSESIENYKESLKLLKQGKELRRTIVLYNELSNVLISNNKYEEASKLLFEALNFSESNKYEYGIININRNLGTLFRQLKDNTKAEYHLQKALSLEEKSEKPNIRSISALHRSLGLVKYDQKDYEGALTLYNKALEFQESLNDDRTSMMLHNSIALVYSEQGRSKEALDHYLLATQLAEKSGSKDLITAAILNTGREYLNMGDYDKGIREVNKGLDIAEKSGFTKWQRNAHGYLLNTYEQQGKYKEAFRHLKAFHVFEDSLDIQHSKVEIAELEAKYESDKKERQIELLNKENEINTLKLKQNRNFLYASLALIFLLGLSALVYFIQYKQRQKSKAIIKKQETEKKLLSTVINTEDKERKRFATDLHDGLGPILSSIKLYLSGLNDTDEQNRKEMIDYSNELIDTSISSLRSISNNILPVELGESGIIASIRTFCNKLQFTKQIEIEIEDETKNLRIETSTELILYRVVQELINNTIKHADANKIKIHFESVDKKYLIVYEDDGQGFDLQETLNKEEGHGIGLQNIKDRVESLQGEMLYETDIDDGVKVSITVNL